MKTITFLNEKGGVGKTTMATATATWLAQSGYRTLLVDGDQQGHATMGVRKKEQDGLFALLTGQANMQQVVSPVNPTYYGADAQAPNDFTLFILPGSSHTAKLAQGTDPRLLGKYLKVMEGFFDFVVIDTSPSISDLHVSFYLASDWIICPTECEFTPMQGLKKSIEHLHNAQEQLRPQGYEVAEMLGILPTKFERSKSLHVENLGYLKGRYEDMVFAPMRLLTDWGKASQLRTPINMLGVKSAAAAELEGFAQAMLSRMEVLSHA